MDVERTPGRRGRVALGPAENTGPVAAFARRLWELKRAAGDPSYDRMRGEFGALASKSALSAAARGRHLPSWETTWEFVRVLAVGVLGRDETSARLEWRGLWERAREPEPAPRRRSAYWLAAAVALVLVVALALVFGGAFTGEPAASGDVSEFVGDVTVPDGSPIPAGSRFVKTWELRNAGSVGWIGRYLVRSGSFGSPDECRTPARVPVPYTAPGEQVRISVDVQAPPSPGHCQVYWKMADAEGHLLLPDDRAVFFSVRIVP
ncbi:MAG: hypothetical protein QOI78_3071 [Actinomycetota bacterium]|jgi:hypothetical protein|nr:hypothetical protein [Actinomycetota bacterium]